MVGPLQALMEEEEALKRKLKGRRQDAVAAGYERRSLLESGDQLEAPKSSAARRDTIRNCREARRPSMPDGSSAGPSARIESLMKPTTANKMRSTDKRKTETPLEEKKPEESPEEAEERRAKWEKFQRRTLTYQEKKEAFLEAERRKKEEQEMEGCTFKPLKANTRKIFTPSGSNFRGSGTLFERAQLMEAKKQEKIQRIRQELFDKEMAQCSFTPQIIVLSPREREADLGQWSSVDSRRDSASSHAPLNSYGADRAYSTPGWSEAAPQLVPSRCHPANASGGYARARRDNAYGPPYEASEGSEYWDGSRSEDVPSEDVPSEEVSLGSAEQIAADDLTILPPGGRAFEAWPSEAASRPPRPPSDGSGASQLSGQSTFDDRAAEQFKVLQRLQDRRRLLEDTLSPDASFPSPGVASFAAAYRVNGTQRDLDSKFARATPVASAGVAEAVERMEALLSGDLSELDDSIESEDVDSGDDVLGAEAPIWGGKLRNANRSQLPSSPSRGGC